MSQKRIFFFLAPWCNIFIDIYFCPKPKPGVCKLPIYSVCGCLRVDDKISSLKRCFPRVNSDFRLSTVLLLWLKFSNLFDSFFMMNIDSGLMKNLIMFKKDKEIEEALSSGWDPNVGGGWPIRLAARYGSFSIVETLIRYGANPNLLSESGASTLQLAVYSGEYWDHDHWSFLLSCCDSSQLADGAAVAIIFNNSAALQRILETGRCNAHIPTTLTGKTLEQLAKGYKMMHLLNTSTYQSPDERTISHLPRTEERTHRSELRNTLTAQQYPQRNLSPSVARFFEQTAAQPSLTSPRRSVQEASSSPTTHYLN